MSEVHFLMKDHAVTGTETQTSLLRYSVFLESDIDIVGFSQFHAGSPSLCYDILY